MKTKLNLLGLLICFPFAGITAQAQESKVMQVHSGGSVVYEVPTMQVDSITFKPERLPLGDCKDDLFYYYQGKKIFLDHLLLYDWLFVVFYPQVRDAEIVDYIDETGLFEPVNPDKITHTSDGYCYLFINSIETKTCSQLGEIILTLEKAPIVAVASLAFEIIECLAFNCSNIGACTPYFYVKVKNKDDLSDLYAVARETNTWIVRQDKFMPEWFALKADKNSKGNAMQMAIYFYETERFAAATPDIMSSNVSR